VSETAAERVEEDEAKSMKKLDGEEGSRYHVKLG
jgi:hypothetical protein